MNLAERFDAVQEMGLLNKPVPEHVRANLAPTISLRPYQEQALARFFYYADDYPQRKTPRHLLFHMATGSGKTVLMAALILDLYARGYRDFLFFVDKTQIVEKTKANFLNPASSKYLFADGIRIDDRPVAVREVSNFAESDADSINIRFTTLGALHGQLKPGGARENGVTREDFEQRERGVVLIADEAHHLNAETRAAKGQSELDLKDSWESTVRTIFESHLENVMLDFTATQDFRNSDIAAKYEDKILYDFSLKRFREEGYSKDIILRQVGSDFPARMMQAAVLSEYRRRLVALYAFEDGGRFEPDFLLFLKDRRGGERVTMQLFVEPKGLQLEQNDGWKQDFLRAIGAEAILPIIEGKDYRVYGLPFYNEEPGRRQRFEQAFELMAGS